MPLALGGDPFLQLVHANAFIKAGELAQAKGILSKIIDSDPQNLKAHWLLVSAALEEKDYQTTAMLLSKIRDELGNELADLTQIPEYTDFIKSEAYEEWLKNSAKR